MLQGVLIVSHPGGALLFNKSFSVGFGLTHTAPGVVQVQTQWAAWNLAALLSAVQLYSSNLSSQWPDHSTSTTTTTSAAAATSTTTTTPTSTPASMSCFTFNRSTLHFWYNQPTTDNKTGWLTVVIVRGAPSNHSNHLARAVSEKFAAHCQGKVITQPMRGFSSPFRNTLGEHLTYLVHQLSLMLFAQYDCEISWMEIQVQLPRPPPTATATTTTTTTTATLNATDPEKKTTTRSPTTSTPPLANKPTHKPKRPFFRRFFRRQTPTPKATTATATSTTTPTAATAAALSTNSSTNTPGTATYCFMATDTHLPDLRRVRAPSELYAVQQQTASNVCHDELKGCASSTSYVDRFGDCNLQVDVRKTTEQGTLAYVKSAVVTTVFPCSSPLPCVPEKIRDVLRAVHMHATLLAMKTKYK